MTNVTHEQDSPLVSDAEYDAFAPALRGAGGGFPESVSDESLTQKVGAKASEKFNKIQHRVPMLSLANAFADEEVAEFVERIRSVSADQAG